ELIAALEGLGDLLAAGGRKDEAIACFRRAAEAVRRDMFSAGFALMTPQEIDGVVKSSLARVQKLDQEIGEAFTAMDAGLAAAALAQAEKYVAAKMPRNALRVL